MVSRDGIHGKQLEKKGLPQCSDTTCFENECRLSQGFTNPTDRKGSQDMTMRYYQDITFLVLVGGIETVLVIFFAEFGDECV